MNQEAILAVLPSSKDDAKSLKEIANEMGLDITARCRLDPSREAAVKLSEGFGEMRLCGPGAQAERRGPAVLA